MDAPNCGSGMIEPSQASSEPRGSPPGYSRRPSVSAGGAYSPRGGGDLGRGQAARLVGAGRALDGHRVEPAGTRIVDLAVDQPIEPVTRRNDSLVQGGQ